jgi:hypothetical protein
MAGMELVENDIRDRDEIEDYVLKNIVIGTTLVIKRS